MKLEKDIPFKKYHKVDITQIKECFTRLDEKLWYLDTSRQAYNNGPHAKTNSLILQYCRGEPELNKEFIRMFPVYKSGKLPIRYDLFVYPDYEDFKEDVKHITEIVLDDELNRLTKKIALELEQKFNGKSALICYVKLPAGKVIPAHIDSGFYLSNVHRLHIPIFTNNMCIFKLGNAKVHMEESCVYEINNKLDHGVENLGADDRIHLIIDIIPNAILNNI